MGIGSRIKLRRIEMGLSLRDLSNRMGYANQSTIARIEEGSIDIPYSRIDQFASVLGVSVEYLMGIGESTPAPTENSNVNKLGQIIREARKAKGLTQEELGRMLGIEKSAVAKYENGRVINIKRATLQKLSEILDISPAELIAGSEVEDTPENQGSENDNRSIFAKNLRAYMVRSGKSRREVSQALGVSYYTFTDWYKGKKYPRIDKIQALADYFGISKSDLVEENDNSVLVSCGVNNQEKQAKQEILDVIIRLHTDSEFLAVVETISKYDSEKIATIQRFLDAFST